MSIRPKTGRRNYAKGGLVYDDPDVMNPGTDRTVDYSRPSDMTVTQWMALDSQEAIQNEMQQRYNEVSNPNLKRKARR
jgi:hypothetical protein